MGFPAVFDVDANLTGSNGFKLTSTSGGFGRSIASAGDFNGDEIQDIVIGNGNGDAYVIFGSKSGFQNPYAVDPTLTGTNGFKLTSISGYFGRTVASAGDFNGDRIQDIVIGACSPPGCANSAYVVFGTRSIFQTSFNVDFPPLTSFNGFQMTSMSSNFGQSVASAGDLNGDGIQDILVGASGVYIIFGSKSAFVTPFPVDSLLNGTSGLKLTGGGFGFGGPIASAGDLNGDNIDDIILGSCIGCAGGTGEAYVVFGTNSTFPCIGTSPCSLDVSALLNSRNGFKLTSTSGTFGWSVAGAGDVNGDGIQDIVTGTNSGNIVYVIFGSKMPFRTPYAVDSLLTGSNGFTLISSSSNKYTRWGSALVSAGDLNGDGIQDILIGTDDVLIEGQNIHVAYVVFGSRNTFQTPFDVDSLLNGSNGFKLTSSSYNFGYSVAGAVDINGDGLQDIVTGAYGGNVAGAGAAYVVYGQNVTAPSIAPIPMLLPLPQPAYIDVHALTPQPVTALTPILQPSPNYVGSAFPAVFNVDVNLTGSNGFKLTSMAGGFGVSVASAGDFNGDKIQDIIIGDGHGDAYIVFGSKSGFQNPYSVDSILTGVNGFKLTSTSGYFGKPVASAGDFNGDGIQDIVIGTINDVNAAYVIFGSNSTFQTPFNVDVPSLTGSNGFKLTSTSNNFGSAVASAGDFNGDGIQDIIIGAGTSGGTGSAYVIYGNRSTFQNPFVVDSLLIGSNGFKLISSDYFGASVASAGDLNADGIQDIMIGSCVGCSRGGNGRAYVVFGSKSLFPCTGMSPCTLAIDSFLTGSNGFTLTSTSGLLGVSVASAGDLNADGIQDIVVGIGGGNVGAYVIFGSKSPFRTPYVVDSLLTGTNGFILISSSSNQFNRFGSALAGTGDINGDGIQDILIGTDDSPIEGKNIHVAYVVFGSRSSFQTPFDVDSLLDGTNGFKLTSATSNFGYSVASAGDINKDGLQDIVIGAYGGNVAGAGATYVVYGQNCTVLCPNITAPYPTLLAPHPILLQSPQPVPTPQLIPTPQIGPTSSLPYPVPQPVTSCIDDRSIFPAVFNVDTDITGSNGFKLTSTSNQFGHSVASVGDFNKDGVQDIVIGANGANAAYVIFGSHIAFQTPYDVDSILNGTNGFKLTSISNTFGWSVAGAGDLNGDGVQDIVIGTYEANDAYVVFGSKGPFQASYNVDSSLMDLNGFKLTSTSSNFGTSVASAGDLNGDWIQDIIIGASGAAAAYVIFGSRSPFQTPFAVDSLLNGTNGFKLTSTSSFFGASVASAGDLNGDGVQDIVIGTYNTDAAYVIFGNRSPFQTPYDVDSLLNGSNGFKMISTSSLFGHPGANAGDLNGDGIQDIVIGALWVNNAYVVFGNRSPFQTPFAVDSLLNGTNGFKLISATTDFGYSAASAGDLNGDGIQDIVIGGTRANAAYVVFGNHTFQTPFNVDSLLTGSNGFKLISMSGYFPSSVASAGDLNGDGIQDIVIGAIDAKAAYVIYGQSCAVPPLAPQPVLLPSQYPVPIQQSSPAPVVLPTPQSMPLPVPNHMLSPVITPPAPFPMPDTVPVLQSEPASTMPQSPESSDSSSSAHIAIIAGAIGGASIAALAIGLGVYAKIKGVWCCKRAPMPEDDFAMAGLIGIDPKAYDIGDMEM